MYGPVPPGVPLWGGHSATVGVGRDDLVSGEAVALDLPPASLGLRILSGLIDIAVCVLTYLGLLWLASFTFADIDAAMAQAVGVICLVIPLLVVPISVETATRGKTIGHLATGLRTVRDDAGPIGFRQSATRALLAIIEIYGCLGFPAFLAAAISTKNKRIGDLLAGTYVIRDRHKLTMPAPIEMPPHLAAWATTVDLGPIPEHHAIFVRRFLARRDSMRSEPRQNLAARLTFDIAPYVAPAPPPDAPYEAVLCAVMAERRRRDTARLAREQRLREQLLR